MSIYKSKNYENFSRYLKRTLKLECGHSIAYLLIEKFTKTDKPTRPQKFWLEDLKKRKIISNNNFRTFKEFREVMLSKHILICMASSEEFAEEEANHRANLFRYGPSIKKYIEIELGLSIHERIDSKADENRVNELEINVSNIANKFGNKTHELERKLEGMCKMLMRLLPPDTPERRQIIIENIDNEERCIELLTAELDREALERETLLVNKNELI